MNVFARDDGDDLTGPRRKRGFALGRLRLGETTGRAGSDQHEAAAAAQPLDELVDDCGDLFALCGDGSRDARVLAIHQLDQLARGAQVEVRMLRCAGLGDELVTIHRASVCLRMEVGQYHLVKMLFLSACNSHMWAIPSARWRQLP